MSARRTPRAPARAPAHTVVYVANADSHDIAVLALDGSDAGGALREIDRFATGGTVMPLAVRPDKRVLYASIRSDPFRVLSLAIDPASGRLDEIGSAPLPASMCWISTDRRGRYLLSASYGSSLVSVSPIDDEGVAGAAQQVVATEENAHADPGRSEQPLRLRDLPRRRRRPADALRRRDRPPRRQRRAGLARAPRRRPAPLRLPSDRPVRLPAQRARRDDRRPRDRPRDRDAARRLGRARAARGFRRRRAVGAPTCT